MQVREVNTMRKCGNIMIEVGLREKEVYCKIVYGTFVKIRKNCT